MNQNNGNTSDAQISVNPDSVTLELNGAEFNSTKQWGSGMNIEVQPKNPRRRRRKDPEIDFDRAFFIEDKEFSGYDQFFHTWDAISINYDEGIVGVHWASGLSIKLRRKDAFRLLSLTSSKSSYAEPFRSYSNQNQQNPGLN